MSLVATNWCLIGSLFTFTCNATINDFPLCPHLIGYNNLLVHCEHCLIPITQTDNTFSKHMNSFIIPTILLFFYKLQLNLLLLSMYTYYDCIILHIYRIKCFIIPAILFFCKLKLNLLLLYLYTYYNHIIYKIKWKIIKLLTNMLCTKLKYGGDSVEPCGSFFILPFLTDGMYPDVLCALPISIND